MQLNPAGNEFCYLYKINEIQKRSTIIPQHFNQYPNSYNLCKKKQLIMKHSILGILLALITGAVSKPPLLKKPPTVQVKNGTYIGTHSNSYNQDFFLGIPYAQPPVKNLRFNTAQSLNTTWIGKKPANSYSAACIGYGVSEPLASYTDSD